MSQQPRRKHSKKQFNSLVAVHRIGKRHSRFRPRLPNPPTDRTSKMRSNSSCWSLHKRYFPPVALSDIHQGPYSLSDIFAPQLWRCQTLNCQPIPFCQTFTCIPISDYPDSQKWISRTKFIPSRVELPRSAAACPADRRQVQNSLANCGCRCGNTQPSQNTCPKLSIRPFCTPASFNVRH